MVLLMCVTNFLCLLYTKFYHGCKQVRWLAWLDTKLANGYDITEYEAAARLAEFRQKCKNFIGFPSRMISASGPNGALLHYSPTKANARMIDRDTPYIK